MDSRHIKVILSVGLVVYMLGLVAFFVGTGYDEEITRVDVNRINRLMYTRYNESKYGKLILPKNNKLTPNIFNHNKWRENRKHVKKNRVRQFHSNTSRSALRAGTQKVKIEAVIKDRDLEFMHNMTFNEKADYILKVFKANNKTAKIKQTYSRYSENESTEFFNSKAESTLTKTNSGFVRITEDIYLFSSFYDQRKSVHYVRNVIIARSSKNIDADLWCHFEYHNSKKLVETPIEFYETCENHLKVYAAYIGSCKIPKKAKFHKIYISTLKTHEHTDQLIPLHVVWQKRRSFKNDLSACIPPLFGTVNSLRLIEFIEFSTILGFKHFTFYSHNASSDILRILNHYQKSGIVTLLDWPLPVDTAAIWYHGQSASVWDCLYRNMYVFKHVAFLDIDELIFPRKFETLTDFIKHETKHYNQYKKESDGELCTFRFESAYFDPLQHTMISNIFDLAHNVENYLVTMNSIYRKEDFSKVRTKMIIEPIKIFEIGIHHVSKPMEENFQVLNIKPDVAYIHHYRTCESNYGVRCYGNVADDQARNYRHRLLTRLKWRFYHLFKEILLN